MLVVLGTALVQVVKALRVGLIVSATKGLHALVDLDAGQNALLLEQLHERRAIIGLLPEGFVVQDNTADVLLDPCSKRTYV